MTVFELYKKCAGMLKKEGISDPELDARLIIEEACRISHGSFLLEREREASGEECEKANAMTLKRLSGIPVQHILGKWEFMSLEFSVGEGVLIPRPETEQLCEYVIEKLKGMERPVVYDLCSGSGCIGLTLRHYVPQAQVYMVEKSDEAIRFLELNRINLGYARSTVCIQADVLKGYESLSSLPAPDVIVSNPPYIKTDEIPLLQKEVQNEPHMALDGGTDGYIFYRALCEKWLTYINDGGFIAVECGEGQAETVSSMFMKHSSQSEILKDFNGIDRIVAAWK